jgi:2-oxopent-4-enoate/cis-2-oxohex-4-enoate hydratase
MNKAERYGAELYAALRDRRTVPPLIARDPSLTVEDAYAISLDFLARRRKDGEKVVGKKIGVTSKAVQDMLGVHQPDFGCRCVVRFQST